MGFYFLNMNKKILGYFGEDLASRYLNQRGYQIIAHNYRLGHLELDLIAVKNERLTILEIKTRLQENLIINDSLVSRQQIINLKKAAKIYAANLKIDFDLIHFDLMLIILDRSRKKARIKHYLDIF